MKWTGLAFVCPSSVAIARDMGTNRIQRFLCPDKKWVNRGKPFKTATVVAVVAFVRIANKASAAQCGNTAAGFEAWKNQFAGEARARGVSASTVAALTETTYSTAIATMIETETYRGEKRRRYLLFYEPEKVDAHIGISDDPRALGDLTRAPASAPRL